jgi:hypothetical protein
MNEPEPHAAVSRPIVLQFATTAIREERQAVIRNRAGLEQFWRELHGDDGSAPPPVDFRGVDVVAYCAGPRSSGGHAVSVVGVRRSGRIATVEVVVTKPAPGETVTLAYTYPAAMRSVPKLPVVVRFDVVVRTR